MNRRQLILTTPALILPSVRAEAEVLAEPNYRLWMGDMAYFKKSTIPTIKVGPAFGTSSDYGEDILLTTGVRPLFFFTGRTGVGPWYGFFTGELRAFAEVRDLRTGTLHKLYKYDKIDVRFYDDSSLQIQFICWSCSEAFMVVHGSERGPGGRLLVRDGDRRGTLGGDGKGKGSKDGIGTAPTHIDGIRIFAVTISWSAANGLNFGPSNSW